MDDRKKEICAKAKKVLKQAIQRGYTEPDPLIDLSGKDVMRKIIILAREVGQELEMETVFLARNRIHVEMRVDAPDRAIRGIFECQPALQAVRLGDRVVHRKGCPCPHVAALILNKPQLNFSAADAETAFGECGLGGEKPQNQDSRPHETPEDRYATTTLRGSQKFLVKKSIILIDG